MTSFELGKCYVCSKPSKCQVGIANLCSEECYDEYKEVLNEMAEAMADTVHNEEEEDLNNALH